MYEDATLCKKCYMKKHKLSKKHLEHIVLSNWKEECENCGHVDKVVIDIKEDKEW